MTDDVRAIALRLVDTLGHAADAESFGDEDAWAFVLELRAYGAPGARLPAGAVLVLQELGAALGIKPGAPAAQWRPALEAQFGPCPHAPAVVAEVVALVRAAVNGDFEHTPARGGVKLNGGEPIGPRPRLKNLDFGEK